MEDPTTRVNIQGVVTWTEMFKDRCEDDLNKDIRADN